MDLMVIAASFKPAGNTSRNKLVYVKDKQTKKKISNLVYGIVCGEPDCSASYVGETKQSLKARVNQHRRPSSNESQNSAVYLHIKDTGHPVNFQDCILDKEEQWHRRGIKRDANLNVSPGAEASVNSIGPNEDVGIRKYSMKNSPHGYCLIINNYNFELSREINKIPMGDRRGSHIDAQRLEILFRGLGYNVQREDDLSAKKMFDIMWAYCQQDHSKCDCIIICILSHGKLGHVYGCDGEPIEIRQLTELFTGVKCPSLVGKPKVFFLQACQGQGSKLQCGVKLLETDDDHHEILMIPNDCDFLLGYSTTPGYASLRSVTEGSWYIGSLVETIESHHKKLDMLNLLALVNDKISMKGGEGLKQASYQANNLRKALYL